MDIRFVKVRKDSNQTPLKTDSYLYNRIGLWGSVLDVHSESNSVDVITDTGYKLSEIPVISKEWICNDENKDFVSGTRSLPPKFSRVFILMPNHTYDGAFVLCSGYTKGDKSTHGLFATEKADIDNKNNIEEKISLSGWKSKEYYLDGNRIIESKNGDISLKIILSDNSKDNLTQGVSLSLFGHTVIIEKDKINLSDKNGNKITGNSSGLVIEDKNGNKITGSDSGWDLNGYLTISSKAGV